MSQRITCSDCGAERPPTGPCPECGGTGRAYALEIAEELDVADALTWTMRSPNSAMNRRLAFESAVSDVEVAVAAGHARNAQDALKRALEMIHELDDCSRRGEWAQTAWTPDEEGLWTGHIGARNAVHHYSSATAGVAALHSGDERDDRLTWDVDPAAIASVSKFLKKYGPVQASEYHARLAGKPVLPGLRQIATLLGRSIS